MEAQAAAPPAADERNQASLPPEQRSVPPVEAMGTHSLPAYARSLLRIKVPMLVTLASKRQSIGKIIELGPGSIIQFDKSCEELLEVHVGGQRVAQGEAVKVGDKFGIRIMTLSLTGEP